jgi:hypothetical protein
MFLSIDSPKWNIHATTSLLREPSRTFRSILKSIMNPMVIIYLSTFCPTGTIFALINGRGIVFPKPGFEKKIPE